MQVFVRLSLTLLLLFIFVSFEDSGAETVKIAIPSTTQAVLPFTIARDKGYYRAEGLDVELILMSAPTASRALLSDDVAVATVGGAGLPPVLRGSPFKFLFTTYNRAMFWLFAKPEIRDVRGLKGKRIGVSGIGSGPDSLLREILRQNGLDANRDVAVLSLGVMPTIFAGLQAGTVDAAMLSPPVTFKAEEAGFRELVSFPKQDLVELQGSVLVRDASLQSNRAQMERFLRGTYKGFLHVKEDRAGTIPFIARYLQLQERLAANAYDQVVRPAMTPDGTLSSEMQAKAVEHVLKRLDLKEAPPLAKIFDFSLTRKIMAELKGWRSVP
ncbi:MAG TPA: ABC transporter substrate-binding protein [Candidatus Binatia bacterium]|nr:ABC transporter substrate-binding protein [Candidatus Binatia bacterium]